MPAFLILHVADTRLALPLTAVREVLPLLPIDRVPGLPRPLVGFVDLRGRAVPVLAPLLLLDPAATLESIDLFAHLVVLHGDAPCLLADRVEDVVTGDADPVDPAHSLNGAITGELALAAGTAHVVDPARLLLDAERSALARLTAAADARRAAWGTA